MPNYVNIKIDLDDLSLYKAKMDKKNKREEWGPGSFQDAGDIPWNDLEENGQLSRMQKQLIEDNLFGRQYGGPGEVSLKVGKIKAEVEIECVRTKQGKTHIGTYVVAAE